MKQLGSLVRLCTTKLTDRLKKTWPLDFCVFAVVLHIEICKFMQRHSKMFQIENYLTYLNLGFFPCFFPLIFHSFWSHRVQQMVRHWAMYFSLFYVFRMEKFFVWNLQLRHNFSLNTILSKTDALKINLWNDRETQRKRPLNWKLEYYYNMQKKRLNFEHNFFSCFSFCFGPTFFFFFFCMRWCPNFFVIS